MRLFSIPGFRAVLILILGACLQFACKRFDLAASGEKESYIPASRPSSRIPEEQMIDIAKSYLVKKGINIGEYEAPKHVAPLVLMKRLYWTAHFNNKGVSDDAGHTLVLCGDDLSVNIEDSTGTPKSMSGM